METRTITKLHALRLRLLRTAVPRQHLLGPWIRELRLPPPTRDGYIFDKWYTDNTSFLKAFDFNTPITEHITLYAKWIAQYTVSFESNEGSGVSPQTVDTGKNATKPDAPTRGGYIFDKWYTDNTSFLKAFDFNTPITQDITLYAQWIKAYTVTFVANGGVPLNPIPVRENGTLSPQSTTRNGFVFEGWYTDDNTFHNTFDFNTSITDDITLYAKWRPIEAGKYTVSFHMNGSTSEIPTQEISKNDKATKPDVPTRNQYKFDGWYTDNNIFKVPFEFNKTLITEHITLYAKWIAQYTVSFESNEGSGVSPQTVDTGKNATKPGNPMRNEYVFDGWYTDKALQNIFSFSTAITKDTILYAKWIAQYTVSFRMNGGTPSILKQTVDTGNTATKPGNPMRSDYRFGGWYTDDNTFRNAFSFSTAITKNTILYAKWILRTYTVLFTMNGSIPLISKQTVDTGAKATKPDDPTRGGYIFGRWYIDAELGSVFNFETAITDDTILYAKWDTIISLAGIIARETIPQDLSPYDEIVQTILAPYESGAEIVARYVTEAGAENKDGSAWERAKAGTDLRSTLQGIDDAASNKVYLLLIGSGEYKANTDVAKDEVFLAMKNHVAIVGGWDSSEYWARAADTHTVLSGDDTRRVFLNRGIDSTALLYGVEITKGKGRDGGGMYNYLSSPVLMNVTFSGNAATDGGGMYNYASSPVLTNVTFLGNTATDGGGGMNSFGSSPVLTNVTFSGNTAEQEGGGMNSSGSVPVLTNVTFLENTAGTRGGGMFNTRSFPTIVNAVFWGNTAPTGPQIHAYDGGTITFAYSVIDRGDTTNGILLDESGELPTAVVIAPEYTDPSLGALANNGGFVSTHAIARGGSAINIGLYVRRKGSAFYYSTDKSTWYTGFGSSGLVKSAIPPGDAIDLTATDATGHERTGRPDAGAYEAH